MHQIKLKYIIWKENLTNYNLKYLLRMIYNYL